MIIKFTVTLSDATVAAFAREGATTGQAIKTALVEAIQHTIDSTKADDFATRVQMTRDDDEDDEDDDPDDNEFGHDDDPDPPPSRDE